MTTARQPRGIRVGGQFAATSHAPSTVVLRTNESNYFARIATVEQLDAEYDYAMSPENLSHDGERSISMQRAAANSMHHDYTERRLELVEASNAVDYEYGEALKLEALTPGQSRTVPASLHRIEGVEDITLTNVGETGGRKTVKIQYTLEDPHDVLDLAHADRDADAPAARGALETALEEQLGLDLSQKLDGPPADGLDITGGKLVVTQHVSFRTVAQGALKAEKAIDKEDLSDWAGGLTSELRDAKSAENIKDRFREEFRDWGRD